MSVKEREKAEKDDFWSNDETNFLLLKLKERNILKSKDGRNTQNAVVFNNVSGEMEKAGFHRTPEQCRVRWRLVKQTFLKARKNNTDAALSSCGDVLEDLLGHGPARDGGAETQCSVAGDADAGGGRKRQKMSKVWNHFTLRKTDNVVRCGHCAVDLAYHNTTSSMLQHLKRRHPHVNIASGNKGGASASTPQQRVEDGSVRTGPSCPSCPSCTVEEAAGSRASAVETPQEVKEEPWSLQVSEEASGSSPGPEWDRTRSPRKDRTDGSPPRYATHPQSGMKRRRKRRTRCSQEDHHAVVRVLRDMNRTWTRQLQRSEEREEAMLERIIQSNAAAASQLLECIRSLQPALALALAPQPIIVPGSIQTLTDNC